MPLIEEVVHHSAALEPLDGDDAELHEDASSSKVNLDAAVAEIEAREAEHGWQTLVEGTDGDRPAVDEDGNVLSVFGEQSLHNYPDIHADWRVDPRRRAPRTRTTQTRGVGTPSTARSSSTPWTW